MKKNNQSKTDLVAMTLIAIVLSLLSVGLALEVLELRDQLSQFTEAAQ